MLLQQARRSYIEEFPVHKTQYQYESFMQKNDEIAYMNMFYPPFKFTKFTPIKTELKPLQESILSVSQTDSDKKSFKHNKPQDKNSPSKNINEYELSEIKAKNKNVFTHSKRKQSQVFKQQERSQFEYRLLLQDLNFEQNHSKIGLFSQKTQNQNSHFQFSQRKSSFNSHQEGQELFQRDFQIQQKNQVKINVPLKKSVSNRFKWDPPSELLFRKQNRLKILFRMLTKKLKTNFQVFLKNMEKSKKSLPSISSYKINLMKLKLRRKK